MSSLWKKWNMEKVTHQQYFQKRPSSKCGNDSLFGPAQDQSKTYNQQIPHLYENPISIERISLLTFFRSKLRGSMTVEAAVVLPLFLMFFLNLSCAIEMIRLHGNLELALWHVGNKVSVYGHVLEDLPAVIEESVGENKEELAEAEEERRKAQYLQDGAKSDWNNAEEEAEEIKDMPEYLQELGDVAFSYQYVKGELIQYLGEDYLSTSPLLYGSEGLQFLESEIFSEDDCFEIVMTYGVAPWIRQDGILSFRMANRYYGHIWNGYEIPGAEGGVEIKTVYVAENGEVYHTNRNCTHLMLTIKEISFHNVGNARNVNGGRYTPCELCVEGNTPQNVYIGVEGDRYHFIRECSGLKRTFYSVLITEVEQYPLCSRCEKGNRQLGEYEQ